MKRTLNLKHPVRGIIFAGFLAVTMLSTGSAWAFSSHRDEYRGHHPRYGERVHRLPHGYRDVWVGRSHYYHHGGWFYRRGPSGFIVVRPPLGAVVLDLPIGFGRLVIGGSTYFTYGGIYYRRAPSGYVVVDPPPQVVVQSPPTVVQTPPDVVNEEVSVVAERLNVRSGPGLDQEVVTQVYKGDVLTIKGNSTGWWYVETPDGQHGWVMTQYTTTPLSEQASG